MRRASILVCFALAAACGDAPEQDRTPLPEAGTTGSDGKVRDLPRRGYIPEGAPLKPPPAPKPRKGAVAIDFDTLSAFDYDPEADIVPDDVLKYDGKLVELRGVMYYAVEDPAQVKDFYLMPNHYICCFGTPRLNEAVEVIQRKGQTTEYVANYYLIRGKLEIGQVRDEDGNVLCLYRIADAEVEVLE